MKILLLSLFLGLSFSVGAAEWTKGEIRRIDLNAKKVTKAWICLKCRWYFR